MTKRYVPERADLIWLDLHPQAGHEQSERRPAVVLSPQSYNRASGLVVVCPVTSRIKGYPFEVALPAGCAATGVIIADQIRSVDWVARHGTRFGTVPTHVLNTVKDLLIPLLGF